MKICSSSTAATASSGRQPGHLVGLGGDVAGALALGQVGDEEPGAVAPRLEDRRQPAGPGAEQVGAQHQAAPVEELGEARARGASRATRSASQSSPVVSATTVSADGPASSTPDSSNVSRTAAQTSARAVASSVPSRCAHSAASGPAQATAWSKSRGSTPPPGKTHMPAGERHRGLPAQQVDLGPARSPGRSSTTVAALRGSAGSRLPSAYCACLRDELRRQRELAAPTLDLDDQLDLDRRVQRQHRYADGRAGVDAGLAEDLAEQLGGAVGDRGWPVKSGVEATNATTLTIRLTVVEVTDLGLAPRRAR